MLYSIAFIGRVKQTDAPPAFRLAVSYTHLFLETIAISAQKKEAVSCFTQETASFAREIYFTKNMTKMCIRDRDYGNAFRASLSIAVNPCFGSAYRRLFLQQFVGDRQCTGNILDRHFAEGNNNRIRRSRRFVIPIGSGGLGQCIGCLLYTSRCV